MAAVGVVCATQISGNQRILPDLEKLLIEACEKDDLDSVCHLLEMGASVEAIELNRSLFYDAQNYKTPLQAASKNGRIRIVENLIAKGANVNAGDRYHITALHLAVANGHAACVSTLLINGADVNIPCIEFYCTGIRSPMYAQNVTPLHIAAGENYVDITKELIQFGADYNATDSAGQTPLYIAAYLGHSDCVLMQLECAIGKDILSLPANQSGDTPLHCCVRKGMLACVRELVKHGSDVSHRNSSGMSPLHCACSSIGSYTAVNDENTFAIIRELVLNGYNVDINQQDSQGLRPLHYAIFNEPVKMKRRVPLAIFLLAYGADPDVKRKPNRGESLLQQELKSPLENWAFLHVIVNCMLHLPPLVQLGISSLYTEVGQSVRQYRVLFNRPGLQFESTVHDRLFGRLVLQDPTRPPGPPLQLGEMQDMSNTSSGLPLTKLEATSEEAKTKINWYADLTRKPRTLQHYCRFKVRSVMGHQKLKQVRDLPIPKAIQDYLLLNCDQMIQELSVENSVENSLNP